MPVEVRMPADGDDFAEVIRRPSWEPGTYVVVAVGAPRHRPSVPMAIRRRAARDWRLEIDGAELPDQYPSMRAARMAAAR